jgi:broad specificity phosphatase PhoE
MAIRMTVIHVPAPGDRRDPAFPDGRGFDVAARDVPAAARSCLSEAGRLYRAPEIRLGLAGDADSGAAALREVDYGRWAGRGLAGIAAASPGDLEIWRSDPAAAPHGGESLAAARARVADWLGTRGAEPGGGVALVSATICRLIVVTVLDAPTAAIWRLDPAPWAALRLTGDGRRWLLRLDGGG